MTQNSFSVLCLSLLLFHTHFLIVKTAGGSIGRSVSVKKGASSSRSNTRTNTNTARKTNQGSTSHGGHPKQPVQPNPGHYPPQSGRPGNQPDYPQHPSAGGYNVHYPARGSPYGVGHGGYGSRGGVGGTGSHGSYGGGCVNQNPNKQILSPHSCNSFGYGGYGVRGGSAFSHSVQQMGVFPSDKSRGFGRTAVLAATGGAVAGAGVGYGLGTFPRPHFNFHNRQEEYHYNRYMSNKYKVQSTDTNDYSRDYSYSNPPVTYDNYMDNCMKRTDLLSAESRQPDNKPAATTATSTAAPDTTRRNSTAADNSTNSAPSTPRPLNESEANPASQVVRKTSTDDDDDDDTVSIVEIGYPALIEQMKARRCLELYIVYSETYSSAVVQGLGMGWRGLLIVLTSTILMLLNSNMLLLN